MRERLKTLVLVVLIALSLQLTSLYFLRVHAPTPLMVSPGFLPEVDDEEIPASYIDLFAPHYILAHNRNRHYFLEMQSSQYSQLWEALKDAVDQVKLSDQANDIELSLVSANEWLNMAAVSYEFRYAGPIQLHYWWLTASKATLQKFSEDVCFNRMLIPLGENSLYLANTRTEQIWKWQWSQQANTQFFPNLSQLSPSTAQAARAVRLPEEVALAAGSQLYTLDSAIALPEILATLPINENNKANIVQHFFNIVPRVRKTENLGNGRVVESYITARQQVLALHNSGLLQYTATPEPPPTPTPGTPGTPGGTTVEQFEQAFNFVLASGGWPKAAISEGISTISGSTDKPGHSFRFVQTYNGIPVIDREPTLVVAVEPGGIRSYQRKTYNIIQTGFFRYEVRSAEEALARALPVLQGEKVSDVFLAYYQRAPLLSAERPFYSDPLYLYPVWVIELKNGERILVHAYRLLNDPGLILP